MLKKTSCSKQLGKKTKTQRSEKWARKWPGLVIFLDTFLFEWMGKNSEVFWEFHNNSDKSLPKVTSQYSQMGPRNDVKYVGAFSKLRDEILGGRRRRRNWIGSLNFKVKHYYVQFISIKNSPGVIGGAVKWGEAVAVLLLYAGGAVSEILLFT